ncbi:MAG: CRTAC1 family protein [Candidatus Solibacter usitatus]|nr:CRTAC1 family protein [Candidatus Solibacter usitatus]
MSWIRIALAAWFAAADPELPVFTDITKSAGITFRHSYGDRHLDNIVEGTGGGACFFDFNNDGFQDIYFVTGVWTRNVSDNEGRDLRGKLSGRLYRNNGNGTFADVTEKAGVGSQVFGSGCSAADYDNDGFADLYLLNYGANTLYHNNGNGTFTDVSKQSGLDNPRWSVSAVWLDYNNDGWLDVYVGNYLLYDDGKFRDFYPAQGYPGPLSYSGQPDALYRNNGDGTFTEVTKEAGVYKPNGRAMSVTAADFNNDGFMDIFVANDAMENYYFENTGKGTFVERAVEVDLAFSEHGQGVSSMGPFFGDVNRDGWLDIFVPNLNYNSLFIYNPKRKAYDNRNDASGISQAMGQYAGWGAVIFDYDHDGWPDIFTVHGNAHHEYVQEDTLVRNKGGGVFEDVSRQSGGYFGEKYVGRGAAWADIDNDGDIDLLVINLNEAAKLLRNDGGNRAPWLMVDARLRFASGARTAIGARVTVSAGGMKMLDDVNPVRGYLGQGDARLHFGLAGAEKADVVEIRWPDGKVDRLENVKANQILKLEHAATAGRKP